MLHFENKHVILKSHGLFASERFGKSHIIKRHFETKLAHGISFIGRLAAKIDIYFFPHTLFPLFFQKKHQFRYFFTEYAFIAWNTSAHMSRQVATLNLKIPHSILRHRRQQHEHYGYYFGLKLHLILIQSPALRVRNGYRNRCSQVLPPLP